MSTKNVNGKILYSLEEVSYQFITYNKNKEVMYKFVDALTFMDVMDRVTIRYEKSNKYHYVLSDWFKDLFKGHYYTKEFMAKGKKVNGTLYFDEYASTVLSRLYLYYEAGKVKLGKTLSTVYKIIAFTSSEFIEPIFSDEEEFIENIDYSEELVNKLQEDMKKNKHVKGYKKLNNNKDKIKEACDKCFDGWYTPEECTDTLKNIDKYFDDEEIVKCTHCGMELKKKDVISCEWKEFDLTWYYCKDCHKIFKKGDK